VLQKLSGGGQWCAAATGAAKWSGDEGIGDGDGLELNPNLDSTGWDLSWSNQTRSQQSVGSNQTWVRGTGRHFAKFLSPVPGGIGRRCPLAKVNENAVSLSK
jgi:hypothetical protein